MKGIILSNIHKKDCRCSFCYKLGKNNPHFGKKHSQALKDRFSLERQGKGNPMYGKKQSLLGMENLRKRRGMNSNFWKGGITPLIKLIRNSLEMKNWRKQIFKRDNYTCQNCFKKGTYLESHHKRDFALILQEFLQQYSQFSPMEDKETLFRLAIMWGPFWDLENGQTLCKDCHNLTKQGREKNV